jgi:hypothetical protein
MAVNMLFYLSPDERAELYEDIRHCLAPDGVFLVSVRDRDAELWRVLDPVLAPLQEEMSSNRSAFAATLQEELNATGMHVVADTNAFTLNVPFGDDFVRVVEFLYRLPPGRLMRDAACRATLRQAVVAHGLDPEALTWSFQDRILLCRNGKEASGDIRVSA